MICIAHQLIFEHPSYIFTRKPTITQRLLRMYTKLSSQDAQKRIALSFYPMDGHENLAVIPPLLRNGVTGLQVSVQPYLLGYILNEGYFGEIIEWHEKNTDLTVHVFWDKQDVLEDYQPRENLFFHQLDDYFFLRMLAGCSGFFCTAGFESVCEALYLGKPVMIVPAHAEQQMNVDDALRTGSVIAADSFNLDLLIDQIASRKPGISFKDWVDSAKETLISVLRPD
jgi:uncharacterized protein (TIGR00661 family)